MENKLKRNRVIDLTGDESSSNEEDTRQVKHARLTTSSSTINNNPDNTIIESLPNSSTYTPMPSAWKPFYIIKSDYPSATSNDGCISMNDIISDSPDNRIKCVILFNFMIGFDWLIKEIPLLTSDIPVYCYHGSSHDAGIDAILTAALPNFIISKIYVEDRFGTHHSKLGFIVYEWGLRVFIGTHNLIEVDNTFKTQAAYVHDFPLKIDNFTYTQEVDYDFEIDMLNYLKEIKISLECTYFKEASRKLRELISSLKNYDFSDAQVILIASVPGKHSGPDLNKWGHLRMKKVLKSFPLSQEYPTSSSLVMQVSSIGSMGKEEKVIDELVYSFTSVTTSASLFEDKKHSNPLVQLVWPTVECVRTSAQGYNAGASICCDSNTLYTSDGVLKRGFAHLFHTWDGTPRSRALSTPHMKCFFRYHQSNEDSKDIHLAWFMLTSCNLSQAAWGVLQTNNTKLYIKSFELGVLFIPNKIKYIGRKFSCTPNHSLLGATCVSEIAVASDGCKFVAETSGMHSAPRKKGVVSFPIPFAVPPRKYETGKDLPWVWDRPYLQPDSHGNSTLAIVRR